MYLLFVFPTHCLKDSISYIFSKAKTIKLFIPALSLEYLTFSHPQFLIICFRFLNSIKILKVSVKKSIKRKNAETENTVRSRKIAKIVKHLAFRFQYIFEKETFHL